MSPHCIRYTEITPKWAIYKWNKQCTTFTLLNRFITVKSGFYLDRTSSCAASLWTLLSSFHQLTIQIRKLNRAGFFPTQLFAILIWTMWHEEHGKDSWGFWSSALGGETWTVVSSRDPSLKTWSGFVLELAECTSPGVWSWTHLLEGETESWMKLVLNRSRYWHL